MRNALVRVMEHRGRIAGCVFNTDESLILTYSDDGTARLWNTKDNLVTTPPMKHDGEVRGAKFNHDESLILTYSNDGTARLWNAKDGSATTPPMKHDKKVRGAVFSHNESLILTYSYDGTVLLWNTKNGSAAMPPVKHDEWIGGAVFNHDESMILTFSDDGTARLWKIQADLDFPADDLVLLVEVVTGTRLDEVGNLHSLTAKEWDERKQKYLEVAQAHWQGCQYKDVNVYAKQMGFWGEK